MRVQLIAPEGLPLFAHGADLAALIVDALAREGEALAEHDVVVITAKAVSKAEGRVVDLASITPSARAVRLATLTDKDPRLVELVLRESTEVIRARPGNLLVRHRNGWVSGMAGVDRSNLGDEERVLLLPEDPDRSAGELSARFFELSGRRVGVVISDSHGRPFRIGNTGVALGAAGIRSVRYLEGQPDLFGRPLTGASVVPLADLVASAGTLLGGEADEGRPVVVVRGLNLSVDPGPAGELIRPAGGDLFAIADRDYG
jgi:coenzyme F420-0:L-glutamate ligase / coenzyme F420-1:gamma-L-glutamate ligase